MKYLTLILFLLLCSCYPANQCVSVSDKHIRGQRNKYVYDHRKCPASGNFYKAMSKYTPLEQTIRIAAMICFAILLVVAYIDFIKHKP